MEKTVTDPTKIAEMTVAGPETTMKGEETIETKKTSIENGNSRISDRQRRIREAQKLQKGIPLQCQMVHSSSYR